MYEYPLINGIKQYIQIRGTNRENPLLLFLHGGPGGSMIGSCHIIQAEWEKHFTVVNWDQRNACKTYFANRENAAKIAKTGTMADYVQDIDEIIAYLHTVYSFEKIILMGFSWGSAIGAEYVKKHPENILCYVAVGQLVQYREGVLTICKKMLSCAPQDSKDAKIMQGIIKDFPQNPVWNQELMKLLRPYSALAFKYIVKHAKRIPLGKILTSPFLNFKEKMMSMIPNYAMFEKSFETMVQYDFRQQMAFAVPALFLFGEEETSCPSELLTECFQEIESPNKKMEIIPQAGHGCFLDQPEIFLKKLTDFVSSI